MWQIPSRIHLFLKLTQTKVKLNNLRINKLSLKNKKIVSLAAKVKNVFYKNIENLAPFMEIWRKLISFTDGAIKSDVDTNLDTCLLPHMFQ